MEQMASIGRYITDDGKGRGMRAFEIMNGSGFDFTDYPDRGLDIGPARYNGLPRVTLEGEQGIHGRMRGPLILVNR